MEYQPLDLPTRSIENGMPADQKSNGYSIEEIGVNTVNVLAGYLGA